jgi:hypothetical protein
MTKSKHSTVAGMIEAMPIVAPPQDQKAFDTMLAEAEADLKDKDFGAFVRVIRTHWIRGCRQTRLSQ